MNFFDELQLHLETRYPLIFVVTAEEGRAVEMVQRACAAKGLRARFPRNPGTIMSLESQLSTVDVDTDVPVLTDLHGSLDSSSVVRLLRDRALSEALQPIVAIVPYLSMPPELEHMSALLELPLPGANEIRGQLERACSEKGVLLVAEDVDAMTRVGQGLTAQEAYRAFAKALQAFPEDAALATACVQKDKQKALYRSNVLEWIETVDNLADVGGMDQLKAWLEMRREAFTIQARDFMLPTPKGLLLMGIQGCGKSLAAKAVANYWHLPIVRLDIAAVFGQDNAERAMHTALKTAEAMAPLVLWIDEIEKGFDSDARGKSARLLGTLITWLQEKTSEVFVVATANRVENLPPELPRKGRFDEIFFVDLPDAAERKDILEMHLTKRDLRLSAVEVDDLVSRTDKMTGSELEQLIIAAMYIAFVRKEKPSILDYKKALVSNVSLYETFEPEIKKLREWARKKAKPASMDRSKLNYFQK